MEWKSELHKTKPIFYLSELKNIGHPSRRTPNKSFFCYILKQLDRYCVQSTLHGLKYISHKSLPKKDKIFWLTVFILSFLMSSCVMIEVWDEWVANPFVIVYDSKLTPIWEIPFPSITICTRFMVKSSYMNSNSSMDRRLKHYLKAACFSDPGTDVIWDEKSYHDYTFEEVFNFLSEATPPCNEIFNKCKFKNEPIDCCTAFQPILTHLGYCYIFNNIPFHVQYKNNVVHRLNSSAVSTNAVYWTADEGYPIRKDEEGMNNSYVLPHWSELPGEIYGLNVELVHNLNKYQLSCPNGLFGFQVVIISPSELPILTPSTSQIPLDTETVILLKPISIRTDIDLMSLEPFKRGCFHQYEKELKYFTYYSQTNCIIDCYSSVILELCGCTMYFLPKNSSVRMCFESDESCVHKIFDMFMKRTLINRKSDLNCHCFSPCSEILYDFDSQNSQIVTAGRRPSWDPDYNVSSTENPVSRLQVFFMSGQFKGLHRERQVSIYDFLGKQIFHRERISTIFSLH